MKSFRFAAFLLATAVTSGAAQEGPGGRSDALQSRGAFFALSVADLEASAGWYVDKLGLRRVKEGGRAGSIAGFVLLEGDGWIVELIRHDDSVRRPVPALELNQGLMKAGAHVEDFDAAVSYLRRRDIAIVSGPHPPRPTIRANLMFRDLEGNLIQLFGEYARD